LKHLEKTQVKGHRAKALYHFTSEYEEVRFGLKLEINCKEHFNVLDWLAFPDEQELPNTLVSIKKRVPSMEWEIKIEE